MADLSHSASRQHENVWATLSSTGAGIAGLGVGLLLPDGPAFVGAAVLAAGLLAHILGMVGRRRVAVAGYRPSLPEQIAFWSCWAVMLVVVAYAAAQLF